MWSVETVENAKSGAIFEQLGNKKSDCIVMAVMEYLQRHPEATVLGAKIKITYQPRQTEEQLLETVRGMVKASVDELLKGKMLGACWE